MQFLTNLKLTLSQYLLLTVSAAAGILLFLVKVKNDELRAARVDLLQKAHEVEQEKSDAKVVNALDKTERARQRLADALTEYNRHVPSWKQRTL